MNFTGLFNHNEFFTTHYLNEIFDNDIKEQIKKWQEIENNDLTDNEFYKTPFKRIKGMAGEYFQFLNEYKKNNLSNDEKLALYRDFQHKFLNILGYDWKPDQKDFEEFSIPVVSEVNKDNGAPFLWVIESFAFEKNDILEETLKKEQMNLSVGFDYSLNFDKIITSKIMSLGEVPRWIVIISAYQIVLIERSKWSQKRFMRFDLEEILSRKEDSTIKALCTLLHIDSLSESEGISLIDILDENSHKHAFGITNDLKYSLRKAIELLGNEALYYIKANNLNVSLNSENFPDQLTDEALRYMYRMLFLFFIESRPELGFIPEKSQTFIKGYSLENLRDLELMPLHTDNDKNGYFFDKSIKLYFDMIFNGRDNDYLKITGKDIFSINPLRSHLFDPKNTVFLNKVKIRNFVWQEIIQNLSLSKKDNKRGRGRISYANLGINQLGAVYEALLSYKGFIAEETLYEVKKANENVDEMQTAYFVNEEALSEYKNNERVFNEDKTIKKYEKGTFIYRLSGRDRENSASYYTPEVLTKTMVKYALKELLEIDDNGKINKSADDIINITICEPAMGSAAFLNEAINQLAEIYLEKYQQETNDKIPHDKYLDELQKVKMYIADKNCFGVDLNPTAVELAEISLWLNALSDNYVPWFGFQLINGNSLLGARREVYNKTELKDTNRNKEMLWYNNSPVRLTPKNLWKTKKRNRDAEKVKLDLFDNNKKTLDDVNNKTDLIAGRKKNEEIYHFLLPAKGMGEYKDKVIKNLEKDNIEILKDWKRNFLKPYNDTEINLLLELSEAIDNLWQGHTRHLYEMRKKTTDPINIKGKQDNDYTKSSIEYKDKVLFQEKLSKEIKFSSAYKRLKTVMDYWCALWFWPIKKVDKLPSREQFLSDISKIVLKQNNLSSTVDKDLFSDTISDEIMQLQINEQGFIDIDDLISKNNRLEIVKNVSNKHKFLHWELEFADIFAKKGGFDLVLGNPPWLRLDWIEKGLLSEINPLFDLRNFSASQVNNLREKVFDKYNWLETEYINEYQGVAGTQNFLSDLSNYPILKKIRTNLYKCFLPVGWGILNKKGVTGFLHPEGVYDENSGGVFREEIYNRLKYHFQFINVKKLFPEVHPSVKFSINIFSNKNKDIRFFSISNLFLPQTVDLCFEHNKIDEPVEGIKDKNNNWSVKGHKDRIVKIEKNELKLFAELYDEKGTKAEHAKLPAIHSKHLISVLEKFKDYPKKIKYIKNEYDSTIMWNETNAQKDNIIKRQTGFVENPEHVILSGPHFFVGNPLYKTPRKKCINSSHYDNIDLTNISDNYLPRTNYIYSTENFKKIIPDINFASDKKVTAFYRISFREMIGIENERSLISTIIPEDFGHIYTVKSLIFNNNLNLIKTAVMSFSLIADFYTKNLGIGHAINSFLESLPLIHLNKQMLTRVLTLSCITEHYKSLWQEFYKDEFNNDNWTKTDDKRLNQSFFENLSVNWNRNTALRTDYERRQALLEIDVLVAIELELSLEELKTIYRIQFPVLKKNENETFYDLNGRIVFTVSSGISKGFPRKAKNDDALSKIIINNQIETKPVGWEDIKDMKEGEVHQTIKDNTMPGDPVERTIIYKAPFYCPDREKDYEIAWNFFKKENF